MTGFETGFVTVGSDLIVDVAKSGVNYILAVAAAVKLVALFSVATMSGLKMILC